MKCSPSRRLSESHSSKNEEGFLSRESFDRQGMGVRRRVSTHWECDSGAAWTMQNNLPDSELQPDYIGDTGRRGADYISQPFAFLMALTEKGSEHIKQWICHGTAAHAVCHKAIIATLQHNDPCNIDGDLLYQWHRRPSSSLQSLSPVCLWLVLERTSYPSTQ